MTYTILTLFVAVMLIAKHPLRLLSTSEPAWHLKLGLCSQKPHLRCTPSCRAMAAVNGHASLTEPKSLNDVFVGLPTTIFTVMTNLAVKHKTINLGQGFPDEEGPDSMKKLVGSATLEHHNQYPPMFGVPELRKAVARHSKTHSGVDVQWDSETLITVAATEAIAAAFLGILNQGDEVLYRSYMH